MSKVTGKTAGIVRDIIDYLTFELSCHKLTTGDTEIDNLWEE
jgi:hypothetical protein